MSGFVYVRFCICLLLYMSAVVYVCVVLYMCGVVYVWCVVVYVCSACGKAKLWLRIHRLHKNNNNSKI